LRTGERNADAEQRAGAADHFGLITSIPSMNGRSASGMTTEPSSC
jgi:hypothetical protein